MEIDVAEKILVDLAKDKKICGQTYSFGHVKNVAVLAKNIAKVCGLDSEKAYKLGLLHDIGRFFVLDNHDELVINDKHKHPIEGYKYLSEMGYCEEARVCITHAFLDGENIYTHMYNGTENRIIAKVLQQEFDVYDLLIQLADEMSVMDGWCSLESRFARDAMENGCSVEAWEKFLKLHNIKTQFDKMAGIDIYSLIMDKLLFA